MFPHKEEDHVKLRESKSMTEKESACTERERLNSTRRGEKPRQSGR